MPVWAIIIIIILVLFILSMFFAGGRIFWAAFFEVIGELIGGIFKIFD
jgi:hypothetical protein